jgi:hypothetical protein
MNQRITFPKNNNKYLSIGPQFKFSKPNGLPLAVWSVDPLYPFLFSFPIWPSPSPPLPFSTSRPLSAAAQLGRRRRSMGAPVQATSISLLHACLWPSPGLAGSSLSLSFGGGSTYIDSSWVWWWVRIHMPPLCHFLCSIPFWPIFLINRSCLFNLINKKNLQRFEKKALPRFKKINEKVLVNHGRSLLSMVYLSYVASAVMTSWVRAYRDLHLHLNLCRLGGSLSQIWSGSWSGGSQNRH